ncbi:hypothetical protein M438DRAFT_358057 [Aureobasidium pullulans EXF-150]|uniref:Uncharacterized protein n=1 Tax=Aureobasidium pullulans EXF-150 TaxID=1043002 RepID=A0A074XC71_AURPU|nr:uncharacterized protein M438DRAFT_358057 [Aureobasidium pullulans EXF-150]KEQ81339.1 hypothetical protein M438DRAFT_358057 [Aureobasidium pullulans EXF-150]
MPLQAKSCIYRIGQINQAKILILLAHNIIDWIIAARTEAKHIPILVGSAATNAQLHEVETAMRKATIAESLSSHIGWDDFNVDIVDFLSGGPFEYQPAQMKLCKEQWDSDSSTEIEIASKKEKQVTVKRKSIRLPIIEVMIQLRARIRLAQRHLRQLAWYRNPSGTMGRFVTECEAIAAADPVYRARFGSKFHRRNDKDDEDKEAVANPEVLAKLTMTPEQHRSCMEIIRKGDLDV